MKCPTCQFENSEGAKFCNECGSKIEPICPSCGKKNPSGSKFCSECGLDLGEGTKREKRAPETEGERKYVTALFSDLSGYTSMSEKLDPEEVKEIMSRIFGEIAQVVTKYEGFIEKFLGDAVMALFGVPKTHEDDPVRAVKAAREIHDLVKALSPKLEQNFGQSLAMHTGINTGLVVTGEVNVEKGTHGVVGDTLNLASRLADLAAPGEILISPETCELIRPYFDTKPLGAMNIKGKAQPVTPYLVVGELAVSTRFDAAERRGFTAFAGREQELTTLRSCLDKAVGGNGQFVTVVGEAGVGKSRLLYEFRHALDRNKVAVLEGRCQAYGEYTPYFSLLNALRRGLRLHEQDTPEELLEKTVAGILGIDQALEQYLPLYLHLLSIPSKEHPLPKRLQGQELKNAFQDALAAVNILKSKRQPMVLILEDWHWVDEASESALKYLVSVIGPYALMVVVIYRPEYTLNWGNWSYHTPLVLRPLDIQQSENIVKSVWKVSQIPEGLVPLIHGHTGGNPFFIEEICNALSEEGTVAVREGQAYLSHPLEHLSLPETVQAVIRARLDRLDPDAKESLRLAAVIGREFARRILERISRTPEELSQSLETLKAAELIQQTRMVPEMQYMFKHVLTQEVTYETLLRQKRKELHGLVGLAIEELYQERIEEQVSLLHHHFNLAENWSKAVDYGDRAANRAYGLSQFQEAFTLLQQAQACLLKLPHNRVRQELLISLELKMNWSLTNLGDLDRALQICQEAEAIARSLASPVLLGRVFHQYHMIHFFRNRYKKAEEYALQAMEQLAGSGESALILLLKLNLGAANFSLGQWEKAAEFYSEVIRTQEASKAEAEYLEDQPYLPYTHSCTHLGYIRALQGRIGETKKLVQKGHAPELEQVANLQSRIWCAVWHSSFSALVNEDHGALARAKEVLKIAEKTDSPILCFLGYAAKGNALMAAEEFEAAQVVYEKALKAIKGTGHRRFLESVYYNLVQANLALGDRLAAERYYHAALPLVDLNHEKEASRFDCLRGRLLASSSPPEFEQAQYSFERSIKTDEIAGAVVPAAQTSFYLSQMLAQKGEIDRSLSLLNELRHKFQNWGISSWQQKCERELQALDPLK